MPRCDRKTVPTHYFRGADRTNLILWRSCQTERFIPRYCTVTIRQNNCGKLCGNSLTFQPNHHRGEVLKSGTDLKRFALKCMYSFRVNWGFLASNGFDKWIRNRLCLTDWYDPRIHLHYEQAFGGNQGWGQEEGREQKEIPAHLYDLTLE